MQKVAWSGIDFGEGGTTCFIEIDANGKIINQVNCNDGDCLRFRLGAEPCTFCPYFKS